MDLGVLAGFDFTIEFGAPKLASMRSLLKLTVITVFLAAGVFLFLGDTAVPTGAAPIVESAEVSRSLYRKHCASCHGVDGRSQTAEGRELQADDLTTSDVKGDGEAKIMRIISNGKGEMPGFKKKLSAAQIASIAKYIKSL